MLPWTIQNHHECMQWDKLSHTIGEDMAESLWQDIRPLLQYSAEALWVLGGTQPNPNGLGRH